MLEDLLTFLAGRQLYQPVDEQLIAVRIDIRYAPMVAFEMQIGWCYGSIKILQRGPGDNIAVDFPLW